MSEKQYPPLPTIVHLYTEDQMRAYVDADRAQRVPLTIDEAVSLYRGWDFGLMDDEAYAVIRAVEAAHGIHEPKESGDV